MNQPGPDSITNLPEFVWTIIVAGGSGLRFGGRKQFVHLGGRTVLEHSVEAAAEISDGVVVVVPADSVDDLDVVAEVDLVVAAGGTTRAQSVRAGLAAVPERATVVVVHDAARPLATSALFAAVVDRVHAGAAAAVPAVAVTDTIRHLSGGVVDRTELLAVQTPQAFNARALRDAHASLGEATDDATLVESSGYTVETLDGEPENRKLTEPTDLVAAAAMIKHRAEHASNAHADPLTPKATR